MLDVKNVSHSGSTVYTWIRFCLDPRYFKGVVVVVTVFLLALQLPMPSLPITDKVLSSNPADDEVY
jgi:hypothetical protein